MKSNEFHAKSKEISEISMEKCENLVPAHTKLSGMRENLMNTHSPGVCVNTYRSIEIQRNRDWNRDWNLAFEFHAKSIKNT